MIKIGTEKIYTMTEILENLRNYLMVIPLDDLKNGRSDFEISAVAAAIGETADFVRGFVTNRIK